MGISDRLILPYLGIVAVGGAALAASGSIMVATAAAGWASIGLVAFFLIRR